MNQVCKVESWGLWSFVADPWLCLTMRKHRGDRTARPQECAASFASDCSVVRPGVLHQMKNDVSNVICFTLDSLFPVLIIEHMYQGMMRPSCKIGAHTGPHIFMCCS